MYIKSQIEYKKTINEKENSEDLQEYLHDKKYEWLTVTGTAINYPLVKGTDNEYYLTRNHEGEKSIAGAIYYDAEDEPYNGKITAIFGHSMKDGTMFNNLHYFPKDTHKFNESVLIIDDKTGTKKYRPLGFAKYKGDNPFYREVDSMDIYSAVDTLKEKCMYFNNIEINENMHIIALVTCEYSVDNGRLIVFYISE